MVSEETYLFNYIVDEHYEGTIYDYLRNNHEYSSRLISSIIRDGSLLLNGVEVKFKSLCQGFDEILVQFPMEYPDCESVDIELDIIHEDADIIVLNKQPGIVVHPTKSHQKDTLANAIYYHWEEKRHIGKIRFVTRIDMDTSGIVIGAKNKYAHHFIQKNFSSYGSKIYYAIVQGRPDNDEGIIDAPIGREEYMSMKRVVREDAKQSVTEYRIVEHYGEYSLLKLKLLTGRTHQIRVHLDYIGCPIISDSLYNTSLNELINRQALHAGEVDFIHPRSKQKVNFVAAFPHDFYNALRILKKQY